MIRDGDKIVRRHYLFYGRVQCVGFRFKTFQRATELGLTGWVRNLPNGSVEACIQGQKAKVVDLLYDLKHDRFIKIESIRVEELKALDNETEFVMRN